MNQRRQYLAYLLRLWQEGGSPQGETPGCEPALWRASLESPQGLERVGFATLGDLFAYLENETGSCVAGLDCLDSQGEGDHDA